MSMGIATAHQPHHALYAALRQRYGGQGGGQNQQLFQPQGATKTPGPGKCGSIGKLLISPLAYFVRYWLLRGYWKEGLPGFVYACLQAGYGLLGEARTCWN